MLEFIFLVDFSVIKPDIGLLFWTSIIFLITWFMLGRFAFRPIQNALKDREDYIQDSLDEAKKTKAEMANLKAENEKILAEAREERTKILKEAKEAKEKMIAEAKEQARAEAKKISNTAKTEIENQKMAAMVDLKNQSGLLALQIAEKIMKKDLTASGAHESFVADLVNETKLN